MNFFRAWDGEVMHRSGWGVVLEFEGGGSWSLVNHPAETCITSHEMGGVLMQCTGMSDKNGQLIYEGDIVKCFVFCGAWDDPEPLKYENFAIVQGRGCWLVQGNAFFEDRCLFSMLQNVEVVGNIYENPELLSISPTWRGRFE